LAPRKRTRGYAVAILIGLEDTAAHLWQVFSKAVKPMTIIRLNGNRSDPKALYNFHESIINALRPTLKEGVRSIIVPTAIKVFDFTGLKEYIHVYTL